MSIYIYCKRQYRFQEVRKETVRLVMNNKTRTVGSVSHCTSPSGIMSKNDPQNPPKLAIFAQFGGGGGPTSSKIRRKSNIEGVLRTKPPSKVIAHSRGEKRKVSSLSQFFEEKQQSQAQANIRMVRKTLSVAPPPLIMHISLGSSVYCLYY